MTSRNRVPHLTAVSGDLLLEAPSPEASRRRSHTALWALVAVALSSAIVWATVRSQAAPQRESLSTATRLEPALEWAALQVESAKQTNELWSDPVGSYFKLDEAKTACIGVPLPGRVVKVYVQLGSEVKQGDPLFSVSSADLAILNAERRKAALDHDEAEAKLTRVSAIVEAHALPERELFDAAQRLRQAENSMQLAKARQNSLSVGTLSDSTFVVRAPRAGRIIDKRILPGQQLVARGDQALITIADLSTLWLVTDLFEADARGVFRGSRVSIRVPTLPNKVIEGEVDAVSAVVDPVRRTVPVRVRLDNADRDLKVNMFAKAQFLIRVPEGTVTVASSALGSEGDRSYVYVRDGAGQFARRYVSPGALLGGRVLIEKGVAENDEVLIKGLSLLDNEIGIAK